MCFEYVLILSLHFPPKHLLQLYKKPPKYLPKTSSIPPENPPWSGYAKNPGY